MNQFQNRGIPTNLPAPKLAENDKDICIAWTRLPMFSPNPNNPTKYLHANHCPHIVDYAQEYFQDCTDKTAPLYLNNHIYHSLPSPSL